MEIKRCYPVLVGASVVENQLCNGESVTVPNGHKFYLKKSGTESLGASTGTAITGLTSGTDMVIDLTQLLGTAIADYVYSLETATAGAGIAKLKEWGFFTGEYIPHNAGTLESVEATAHKMVGFNQWDEEWEKGLIAVATGQNIAGSGIRSKNLCRCVPGIAYFAQFGSGGSRYVFWYRADGSYIRNDDVSSSTIITSPNDACSFRIRADTITTYNHDICINLSKTTGTPKNGDYVPYEKHTYPLDNSLTLRGIPKLDASNNLYYDGDTYESDGTVTRKYGIVDLGSLEWSEANGKFSTPRPVDSVFSGNAKGELNVICEKYTNAYGQQVAMYNNTIDKAFIFGSAYISGANIYIRDSAYSDAPTFKAAMSGVYLVYELATPITEQSTPFTSPQIVYPDGTEEFVTENGVPVGHETKYQL